VRMFACLVQMPLNLGDTVPNFEADTTAGKIQFHDFIGDSWAILFSHPSDYTPVCTTELGQVQKLIPEFQARGVKVFASFAIPLLLCFLNMKSVPASAALGNLATRA
jgi:hypothetical protein